MCLRLVAAESRHLADEAMLKTNQAIENKYIFNGLRVLKYNYICSVNPKSTFTMRTGYQIKVQQALKNVTFQIVDTVHRNAAAGGVLTITQISFDHQ